MAGRKNWKNIEKYDDLSDNQKRFCDWLTTPKPDRKVKTQKDLAGDLGVHEGTLVNWKYKKTFARIVAHRKRDLAGVHGLQQVVDGLIKRARQNEDKESGANDAAELFLKWFYNEEFGDKVNINQNVNQPGGNQVNVDDQAEAIIEALQEEDDEVEEGSNKKSSG